MSLVLELDPQMQEALEEAFGPALRRIAVETLVAEGYRAGKLTRFQIQKLLGLADRWTAEAWLKEHGAFPHLTLEDVIRDSEASRNAREATCLSSPTLRH